MECTKRAVNASELAILTAVGVLSKTSKLKVDFLLIFPH